MTWVYNQGQSIGYPVASGTNSVLGLPYSSPWAIQPGRRYRRLNRPLGSIGEGRCTQYGVVRTPMQLLRGLRAGWTVLLALRCCQLATSKGKPKALSAASSLFTQECLPSRHAVIPGLRNVLRCSSGGTIGMKPTDRGYACAPGYLTGPAWPALPHASPPHCVRGHGRRRPTEVQSWCEA